jgi:hypothetical protein
MNFNFLKNLTKVALNVLHRQNKEFSVWTHKFDCSAVTENTSGVLFLKRFIVPSSMYIQTPLQKEHKK